MGYLANFIVYTLAMVGVIMLALFIFKMSSNTSTKNSSKFLKVHDTLTIGPRKTLYVVSAGDERFLIAGDVDKTCLISKLGETTSAQTISSEKSFKETLDLPIEKSYIDRSNLGIHSSINKPYNSVMKNLAERIKG